MWLSDKDQRSKSDLSKNKAAAPCQEIDPLGSRSSSTVLRCILPSAFGNERSHRKTLVSRARKGHNDLCRRKGFNRRICVARPQVAILGDTKCCGSCVVYRSRIRKHLECALRCRHQ